MTNEPKAYFPLLLVLNQFSTSNDFALNDLLLLFLLILLTLDYVISKVSLHAEIDFMFQQQ